MHFLHPILFFGTFRFIGFERIFALWWETKIFAWIELQSYWKGQGLLLLWIMVIKFLMK